MPKLMPKLMPKIVSKIIFERMSRLVHKFTSNVSKS